MNGGGAAGLNGHSGFSPVTSLRVQPCHITQGSALPHHSGFSSATSLTLGDRDVKVQVWLPLQADLQRPDQGDPLGQGAEGHHHTRVKLQLQGMVG